ncbi:hypothetical protein [Streptomyces bottropensis]|uniref:hypothetical protein n=1 Tax=Streptomyces bottropensis TaxID=42235 RepID=UPI0036C99758
MEIVFWSSALVVALAALAGRQVLLYPVRWGDRRHAYHPDHADARRELREARLLRRTRERQIRRRIGKARSAATGVAREGERQVQALRAKRAELQRDTPGEERYRLGDLVLYEHALHFLVRAPQEQRAPERVRRALPLGGVKVRVVATGDGVCLSVTWPQGKDSVAYPRADRKDVESLARQISAAVLRETEYRAERQRQSADIGAEVRKIRKETAERKAEKERERDRLIDSLRPDRAKARKDWEAACSVWARRTGCRPRWVWRW